MLGIEISSISTIISQYLFWFSVNQYTISSILAHQQIKEISSIYTWKNRQLIIWQFELINANCDHWFLLGNWAIKILNYDFCLDSPNCTDLNSLKIFFFCFLLSSCYWLRIRLWLRLRLWLHQNEIASAQRHLPSQEIESDWQ